MKSAAYMGTIPLLQCSQVHTGVFLGFVKPFFGVNFAVNFVFDVHPKFTARFVA